MQSTYEDIILELFTSACLYRGLENHLYVWKGAFLPEILKCLKIKHIILVTNCNKSIIDLLVFERSME